MADWNGHARTNYVRIKFMEELLERIKPFQLEIITRSDGKSMFVATTTSGWPSTETVEVDGQDEEVTFDAGADIAPFMHEGEILVVMECGAECNSNGPQYLSGRVDAYNHLGESIAITLGDIYEQAAKFFKVNANSISRCEY